jgi:hypothetical protein
MEAMSDGLPVVGGPLDGQTLPSSTARFLNVPDARDMVTAIVDGEVRLFFGQHTYEMKCYARDGDQWHQWEHVSYEPPNDPTAGR